MIETLASLGIDIGTALLALALGACIAFLGWIMLSSGPWG